MADTKDDILAKCIFSTQYKSQKPQKPDTFSSIFLKKPSANNESSSVGSNIVKDM
jgi:hypothetical protein